MNFLLMFASSFFAVFLLGLQSKNVNQGRYLAAVVTSLGISVANFCFIKYAAVGGLTTFAICAAGGCCGIAFSIWFYDNILTREPRLTDAAFEAADTQRAFALAIRKQP